jgi:hypothetical protein
LDTKTLKSLQQALTDLEAERKAVDDAIRTINGLLGARVGRPRAAAAAPARGSRQRKKPRWSPAMRQAARDRMRKYWDSRRKGSKG